MSEETLLGIADELYGLPLAEFTPARDAVVRERKGEDKDLAGRVKALRKPSLAAWVVNLLVRRDPDQVEQVLEVGAALRQAQDSLDAAQLRELTRQRRQLTAAVTTTARRLARIEGIKVTQAVADQVEATLTAAMLDPEAARGVRSGLLVTSVSTTGLGDLDLSGAVALPDALGFRATARPVGAPDPAQPPQLHVVPDPDADRKARQAAEALVREVEQEADAARADRDEADGTVGELQARTLQLQSEVDELRARLAELDTELEEVDDELSEAEALRAEADERLAEVSQRLRRAQEARSRLDRN